MSLKLEVLDECLEYAHEQMRTASADGVLQSMLRIESQRLQQAALTLGREWNGSFNEGHLMSFAIAYHRAKTLESRT